MNDPCLTYTLMQLRDMARGRIPGFSKMKKGDLCRHLVKSRILPLAPIQRMKETFVGVDPPKWDHDKKNLIPSFLLPYDYIYGAGSSNEEIVRYFILPENFPLIGTQLPSKKKMESRKEHEITVGDYLDQISDETDQPFMINGKKITFDLVNIKGLTRKDANINRIAPRIGSEGWFTILQSLQIVGMEGTENTDAQLRREYQMISYPSVTI